MTDDITEFLKQDIKRLKRALRDKNCLAALYSDGTIGIKANINYAEMLLGIANRTNNYRRVKMRWGSKEAPLVQEWFAWYPVYCRDANSWVWWEKVFIRWLAGGDSGIWDYATKRETHEW